jgi:CheY-like chemotaxis protein
LKKILIVEDNKVFANFLAKKVKQLDGYKPIIAYNRVEAVSYAKQVKFDAALLDLVLPDGQQGEIVDDILEFNIPTIVLTGENNKEVHKKFLKKSILELIVKDSIEDIDYALYLIKRISKNRSMKVLIVDDVPLSRLILIKTLKLQKFQIFEANNGLEALDIIDREGDISIVLTDFHMPKMDGLQLLKEIRSTRNVHNMAVIAFSVDSDDHTGALFMRNGANDFMTKPFIHEEFLSRLYNVTEHLELTRSVDNLNNKLHLLNEYRQKEEKKAHKKQLQIIQNELESSLSWNCKTLYKAADELSGDTYSILRQKDDSVLVYIIDGMGHGVVPALTTFAVAGVIRHYIAQYSDFEGLMQHLVHTLQGLLDEAEQLSFTFFNIDLKSKELKYSIGGMYPALVIKDEELLNVKANNIPMMSFTQEVEIDTITFEYLDKLLLYSDGLVEEEVNNELFHPEALIADEMLLSSSFEVFNNRSNEDDITIVYLDNLEDEPS